LLGVVAAFSSCSTAYRTGQTPDDVYYSPAPQENSYVSTVTGQDKNSYSYRNQEDADIRRGINDPVYRNAITFSMGMGYGYSPYSIYPYNSFNNPMYSFGGYGYDPYSFKGLYNPYNSFEYNNLSFYNSPYDYYSPYSFGGYGYSPYSYGYSPYYAPILFSTKSVNTNTGPRRYNLNVYNNSGNNTSRGNVQPIRTINTGTTQPSRGTGVGNVIRRVFTPSQRNTYVAPRNNSYNNNTRRTYNYNNNNNNNNNTYETPQRTFTPSTPSNSPSSSSEGGSGSSAPVRTFRR
jgi:hypothetical protein